MTSCSLTHSINLSNLLHRRVHTISYGGVSGPGGHLFSCPRTREWLCLFRPVLAITLDQVRMDLVWGTEAEKWDRFICGATPRLNTTPFLPSSLSHSSSPSPADLLEQAEILWVLTHGSSYLHWQMNVHVAFCKSCKVP